MCLAVPLKIVEINGMNGIAERAGVRRNVRLDFVREPQVGDYVLLHAGFAIEKMDPRQAEEDIAAAAEVEQALAEIYGRN